MALRKKKEKALELRKRGMSYSQIKKELNVSKSTLSSWLEAYPLTQKRINELRALNPQRIERFRNTMAKKRELKLENIYKLVSKDISKMSKREIFIGGLFLYWGEGGKKAKSTITLSNTDPSMLIFYLKWLELLEVPFNKLKMVVHMYADMDKDKTLKYWADTLKLPLKNFRAYVKKSKQSELTYKVGFGRGTCTVRYGNEDMANRVMMSLKYIQRYFL